MNRNAFTDIEDAVDRACAIQHNACADAINNGELSDVEISNCDDQEQTYVAAGGKRMGWGNCGVEMWGRWNGCRSLGELTYNSVVLP